MPQFTGALRAFVSFLRKPLSGEKPPLAKKRFTAEKTFSFWQLAMLAVAIIIAIPLAIGTIGLSTFGNYMVALTVVGYVVLFGYKIFVSAKANGSAILRFTQAEIDGIDEALLPVYTILVPLHKEVAMLSQIVRRIEMIDWPANKKEVKLLLEWNDTEMTKASEGIKLPPGFTFVTVPKGKVQTKPNALNHGLELATGEFLTIYDAEDRPDPYQLKKAYLGFQRVDPKVVCLQADLSFHNSAQNLLTMFFAAEYSVHFKLWLPGLGNSGSVVPLGGTSNHFRLQVLRELGGWDEHNVTEDADLGVRIGMARYSVGIIDSTTYEEATAQVGNWTRQRSRWIKGYMQTYLVYMRSPWTLIRELGVANFLIFQLVFGLSPLTMIVNPIFWAMTIVYFVTGSGSIQSLYPTPVFYLAMLSMGPGNLIFLYLVLTGCMLRGASGDKKAYGQVVWMFLVPFYWGLMSVAAWKGLWQLIIRPHHWEKTNHGLVNAKLSKAGKNRNTSPVPPSAVAPEMNSDIG